MNDVPVLISGGRVVDPSRDLDATMDVLLDGGVVAKVDERIAPPRGAVVVDASGLVVAPGFVDLHVHFREPGFEWKETIASGSEAAAAGGFTTVCCMPNTDPVIDDAPTASFVQKRIRQTARVRVLPIGAVSMGQKGLALAEIGLMKAEGIVAISDDGKPIVNADLMRRALEYASMFDLPVVVHEEDPNLVAGGQMNEGWASTRLGLPGWPAVAESTMVARDVELAALTGARLHVAHVSVRDSLAAIRRARAARVPVSCEVTPHHLMLTDEDLARSSYDTRFKMNPPLRDEADRQALVSALADGTIDCVATDHAPHARDEKEVAFEQAPMGTTGLETAFAALYTELVLPGVLDLSLLVERMTAGCAIFGLPLPRIEPGARADVVLVDLGASWVVGEDGYESRSGNCCFAGRELRGRVLLTLAAGAVAYRERSFALSAAPEPRGGRA
jgi:dihydroorotase